MPQWRGLLQPQRSASGHRDVAHPLQNQTSALIVRLQAASATHNRAKTNPPRREIKHAIISRNVWYKYRAGHPQFKAILANVLGHAVAHEAQSNKADDGFISTLVPCRLLRVSLRKFCCVTTKSCLALQRPQADIQPLWA